jgi:hypothetical protein
MNRKTALSLLIVAAFFMAISARASIARAQLVASIEVTDSIGNSIVNSTVPINTIAHIQCTYQDLDGSVSATGVMEVYFNNVFKETLYSGVVADGETITKTYLMNEPGTYEFRWDCTKLTDGEFAYCRIERALIKAQVMLVVPEPGTIAGLMMALSAFGLFVLRKAKR